jgi:rhamnosyltransferase
MKVRMDEQKAGSGGGAARREDGRERTAAVVVTYEPAPEILENLNALRPQVDALIIVDNGSSLQSRQVLRAACDTMEIQLIENGSNLGIATALNRGVEHAMEAGAEWLFLFDQDSHATPGFVEAMIQAYLGSRWCERLKILIPQYRDAKSGTVLPSLRAPEGIAIAWTSGSLLRAETIREFGLFRDELFIDEVDHEYSLRLRKAGMVVDEAPAAALLHALGSPSDHVLFGWRFRSTNYSPARRYYQERNKIWMARHYGRSFPKFVLSRFRLTLSDAWKIVAFEDDRWRKLTYGLRGMFDGLRGRMGKLDDSSSGT